jgi:hypothetical protein
MERIDRLETKVREMIAMVHSLREENGRLQGQVAEYEARMSGLSAEQGVIDEERERLRGRIESMLSDLETLEGTAASRAEAGAQEAPAPATAEEAPAYTTGAPAETRPDSGADAGSMEISLPEPSESPQSPQSPENDDPQQYGFTLEPDRDGAFTVEGEDDEPPARPGADPAHPVLPGFS